MSAPLVKICGINSEDAAIATKGTKDAPADLCGFVFFQKSPRFVSLERAKNLKRYLDPRTKVVALVVDASVGFCQQILEELRPDYFQFHGSETPEHVSSMRKILGKPIIKALSVRHLDDMERARAYKDADMMLFDTHERGGLGDFKKRPFLHDWHGCPYLLAGGLDEDNLLSALEWSGATGVDVSSGVEGRRGCKIPQKIRSFIEMAQTQVKR